MIEIITDISKINEKKWNDFILNHPDGNIFQSSFIYKVYNNYKYYTPLILICMEKNEIMGILLSVIQKEYSGLLGILSSRAIIWGGPVIKNNDPAYLSALLKAYEKTIKGKAIFTQIRNLFNNSLNLKTFEKFNYTFENHLDIIINLKNSEEALWKDVHTKRRNEIRKAEKMGLTTIVDSSYDGLKKSYSILEEVYSRARLPLPGFEFFELLMNNSNELYGIKNFVTKKESEIIGCMLCLYYKKVLYDFYAGSFSAYYKYNPNDIIPWEVFMWGKKNQYETFDFGGAGKPGKTYGVRDYKIKFGGEVVDYGRYDKIHSNLLLKIAKTGFYIWRVFKGK